MLLIVKMCHDLLYLSWRIGPLSVIIINMCNKICNYFIDSGVEWSCYLKDRAALITRTFYKELLWFLIVQLYCTLRYLYCTVHYAAYVILCTLIKLALAQRSFPGLVLFVICLFFSPSPGRLWYLKIVGDAEIKQHQLHLTKGNIYNFFSEHFVFNVSLNRWI